MFDNKISAEFPEHKKWIHKHAIPLLKNKYGLKTTIVQAQRTYTDYFYKRREKGNFIGNIYGFPFIRAPWCNSRLKLNPINKWQKQVGDYIAIVGIAVDEAKRIKKKTVCNKILPLVDYGVTEAEAFEICQRADLLSPAYNCGRERLGCWFCHNQRVGELRRLRKEYAGLWGRFLELDRDSPLRFSLRMTLKDFDNRFAREDRECLLHYMPVEGVKY